MDAHETHEALELHTPPATPSDAMPGALQSAAAAGNVPALLALLAQGAQVNAAGEGGWTPLMFAAACGQPQALLALLAAGADACLMNREEETARSIAKNYIEAPGYAHTAPFAGSAQKKGCKTAARILRDAPIAYPDTALLLAAKDGDMAQLKRMLRAGASPNGARAWGSGYSALLFATKNRDIPMLRLLLAAGADVNAVDAEGTSALLHAVQCESMDAATVLLGTAATININVADCAGRTPLMYAAMHGEGATLLKTLLDAGANVHATDNNGKTALIYAAEYGRQPHCALLLAAGADIAAIDASGRSALAHAAALENTENAQALCRFLLAHGAPSNTAENAALDAALRANNLGTVKMLLDAGADGAAAGMETVQHALKSAAAHGDTAALRFMRQHILAPMHARANAPVHGGVAPLLAAAHLGAGVAAALAGALEAALQRADLATTRLLLEGADLIAAPAAAAALLLTACHSGDEALLAHALAHGADPDASASFRSIWRGGDWARQWEPLSNRRALVLAAEMGHTAIAARLLAAGADVNTHDASGWPPLHAACRAGHADCARLLLAHGARANAVVHSCSAFPRHCDEHTALRCAIQAREPQRGAECVRALIGWGADIHSPFKKFGTPTTPLLAACDAGNLAAVELLLAHGAGSDTPIPHVARSPMEIAIRTGNTALITLLLTRGADVDAPLHPTPEVCGPRVCTPLIFALCYGRPSAVDYLLGIADPNAAAPSGETPLMVAATYGQLAAMRRLLTRGARLAASNANGATALMLAAINGQTDAVHMLLTAGSDPNTARPRGTTALMHAAARGHLGALQALLAAGANPNARRRDGNTALMLCVRSGCLPVLNALLQGGANPNTQNQAGKTALDIATRLAHNGSQAQRRQFAAVCRALKHTLHTPTNALLHAARQGNVPRLQRLLEEGANANAADHLGRTPLMAAARHGRRNAARLLLAAGANPNATSISGHTPLMLAAAGGHSGTLHALLAAGADPHAANAIGHTALMSAAAAGHTRCAASLLRAGADPYTHAEDGTTAVLLAEQGGHSETVQLLNRASGRGG